MKHYKTDLLDLRCCDNMDLMAKYPDKHFDLAVVDPPYGIERFKSCSQKDLTPKNVHAKRFQKMESVNNTKPNEEYFKELFRVSKNQIIWGANNFNLPTSEYFLCWDKEQAMPNFATLELAWVSMGLKKPAKLFRYSIHKHNKSTKIHPTQKPVKLYEWIFKNYANDGDKILDTHLGSGSIAIASHYAGLHLTACEIDEDYFKESVSRIKRETAQQSLF